MHFNPKGYDLYSITENEWTLDVKGGPRFVGTFKDVLKHAVSHLYFEMSELEAAVEEMLKGDFNAAHFGIQKMFIYPYNKETGVKV